MQTVPPSNGQYHVQSDYPEAPHQPQAPTWHGSTPKHSCTLAWVSPSGLSFNWQVNTDNPIDIFDVASFVEKHRKLEAPDAPEPDDTPVDTGTDPADAQMFRDCPLHPGKTMRLRHGQDGHSSWYSHQTPEGWCKGVPQASAGIGGFVK